MDETVFTPTTKEEALAAGVPEDQFDPEIHLFKEEITVHPPQTLVVNATEATDVGQQ